jgi:hypothetical protein
LEEKVSLNLKEIKNNLMVQVPEFANKVAPIYKLLGWGWKQDEHIPDEEEICDVLNGLIDKFCEGLKNGQSIKSSGSGGLEVYIDDGDDFDDFVLRRYGLRFVLNYFPSYSVTKKIAMRKTK